jgi:glucokinase
VSTALLGIDVGGTGIKARLIVERAACHDQLLDEQRVSTPRPDPDAGRLAETVVELVRHAADTAAADGATLAAVGLVVPGIVDEADGRVAWAANLGWHDVAVREVVSAALTAAGFALPLAFGHDVRAGALSEVMANERARSAGVVAFAAVGTGLASSLVVDGRVAFAGGWAGEIGHLRIQTGPFVGRVVEEYASAGAVARRCGEPNARAVADRVRAGDPEAVAAWRDCVDVLADAFGWLTAITGCSMIIVGGGLAEAGALFFDPLRAALATRLDELPVPDVVPARNADAAGAIGAALLARELIMNGGSR